MKPLFIVIDTIFLLHTDELIETAILLCRDNTLHQINKEHDVENVIRTLLVKLQTLRDVLFT